MKEKSYILNQTPENQEKLLKYIETIIIMIQQHIDDKKTLEDLLEQTKKIYWSVKETLVETAQCDLGLKD